ncbi:hypothetical protein niasHT_011520 [Heterodera trifolii]|uniref:Uncharacterized protein n=1 Tax=Heterodera trifolii TaxID=157864 RepID=A0ABD2LGN5_9BILA
MPHGNGKGLLVAVGATAIGLAALLVFVKFSPHFRVYRPLPPAEHAETVADEVEALNVPNWTTDPWERAKVESHLRHKELMGWRMVHLRTGLAAPTPFVLGLAAANQQLIAPGWTVSRYFAEHRELPLRHDDWACVHVVE